MFFSLSKLHYVQYLYQKGKTSGHVLVDVNMKHT